MRLKVSQNFILVVMAALGLSACAKTWVKPGSTQADFDKDRYECLQRSQQQVTSYSYGVYGGSGGTEQKTNNVLFNTCMNSKGWSLRNQKEVVDAKDKLTQDYLANNEQRKQEMAFRCQDPDYSEIYAKTACRARDVTFEQISDKSKITSAQKKNFSKWRNDVNNSLREQATDYPKYFGPKGQAMAAYTLNTYIPATERLNLQLYEGKITWGQYNQQRKEMAAKADSMFRDGVIPKDANSPAASSSVGQPNPRGYGKPDVVAQNDDRQRLKEEQERKNEAAKAEAARQESEKKKETGWYTLDGSFNSCSPSPEGPAGFIESLVTLKVPYSTSDERKEAGQVVSVKVQVPSRGGYVYYLRGKSRCEAASKEKANANKQEIDGYKNRYK